METRLADWIKGTAQGDSANDILRACVHCGFCNATCPTYQLLGDELDGPRGRIYQIKQVLEGAPATRSTQLHLDRCLTCRACETTCPSGVNYGHLVDIGRAVVESQVPRPLHERALHGLLRAALTRRWLFGAALRSARALRFALPRALRAKLGERRAPGAWPQRVHARKVLLLNGCTQPAMAPSIDAATARVLDVIGVQVLVDARSGCCGAIRHHLHDPDGALEQARRNIDAWWPQLEAGAVEAIVINASGCAVMVREYGWLLREDPAYAERARRISAATRDLVEFLGPELPRLRRHAERGSGATGISADSTRIAVQKPCTLQHGLGLKDDVERLLAALGVRLLPVNEAHLCCGSAGTYSLLQPRLASELRERKLAHLLSGAPALILTTNIGCMSHLAAASPVPVWHWIEWVDKYLSTG
jgi:glycolate oxidase iron-sulfur subunit